MKLGPTRRRARPLSSRVAHCRTFVGSWWLAGRGGSSGCRVKPACPTPEPNPTAAETKTNQPSQPHLAPLHTTSTHRQTSQRAPRESGPFFFFYFAVLEVRTSSCDKPQRDKVFVEAPEDKADLTHGCRPGSHRIASVLAVSSRDVPMRGAEVGLGRRRVALSVAVHSTVICHELKPRRSGVIARVVTGRGLLAHDGDGVRRW